MLRAMKKVQIINQRARQHNIQKNGFNLLELLTVIVIIGLVSTFAIPTFQRRMAQGKVDRYMQNLESGLFQLRARMGVIKISCEIDFEDRNPVTNNSSSQASIGTFYSPNEILEIQQSDGSRANSTNPNEDALYKGCRCSQYDSGTGQCNELVPKADSLRLVNMEGTPEAEEVLVSVSTLNFSFTPPGTSASNTNLVIRIKPQQPISKVRERCVEVTGNGAIFTGTWENNSCKKR